MLLKLQASGENQVSNESAVCLHDCSRCDLFLNGAKGYLAYGESVSPNGVRGCSIAPLSTHMPYYDLCQKFSCMM